MAVLSYPVWLTRSFPSAAQRPERLKRNAPLAIVAEPPSFCRSFMTSTWLGVSAKAPGPPLAQLALPVSRGADIIDSSKPGGGIAAAAAEPEPELSRVFVAEKSRMAKFWRFFRGTGSRGRDEDGLWCVLRWKRRRGAKTQREVACLVCCPKGHEEICGLPCSCFCSWFVAPAQPR